ncbi:MAG: rRNA maturation RNase YbeY [Flavobacteriaceae bacterium]
MRRLAAFYKVEIKALHYNFVDESFLLKMNKDFLNHDTHTDIITFSYAPVPTVEAEIYISNDRMRENAILFNEPIENELLRLLSHGFLHCIGYNDSKNEEKSLMSVQENKCIKMFHVKQDNDV